MKTLFRHLITKSFIAVAAAGFGGYSINALAIGGMTPGDGSNLTSAVAGVAQEVHALRKQINALAGAQLHYVSKHNYAYNPDLPNTVNANTLTIGYNTYLDSYLHQISQAATLNAISSTLQYIPDQVAPPSRMNELQDPNGVQRYNNEMTLSTQLSSGVKTSGTLYQFNDSPNHPDVMEYHTGKPKAKDIHNNYIDFNSVVSPNVYTNADQTAVTRFMQYATKAYQPISEGVNFSKLKDASAKQLSKFMQSGAYQKYQLAVRSLMAQESVPLSNINYMIAQRSPIVLSKDSPSLDTLSAAMQKANIVIPTRDIKDAQGVSEYQYPSPLQIQNYIANRRVHSKAWYQKMAAASPATVAREQLYVLAEMEAEMQQQHVDNERLLATISMLDLNSTSNSRGMLQSQASKVNEAINTAMGIKTPPPQAKISKLGS